MERGDRGRRRQHDSPPREHPRLRPERGRRGQPVPDRHRRGDRARPADRARERRLRSRGERGGRKGGEGAAALAAAVVAAADEPSDFQFAYPDEATIEEKIMAIAKKVYGADGAVLLPAARQKAEQFTKAGLDRVPICMAKTHLSLSADASLANAPTASPSPSATCARTPAPAGSSRFAATCRRCRPRRLARRLQRRHRRRRAHGRPFLTLGPLTCSAAGLQFHDEEQVCHIVVRRTRLASATTAAASER